MDDIRIKLTEAIAARLAAAPDSPAKAELVEELTENLYQRYLDMRASGMPEEEAFSRAMEDLGDVIELVDYLNGLSDGQNRTGNFDPLDELMQDVEEIAQNVFSHARDAVQEAKRRLKDEGFYYRSPRGHVEVDISGDADRARPEHPYKKDVVYGVGYDKAKGGFFAQWGEWKGGREAVNVTALTSVDAGGLRGVDIENVNGDVSLRFDEPEDAAINVSGSVNDLEVSRTEDGVLVIREGRTASASSLLRRGLSSCVIELSLPCRSWDYVRISSVNGDVDLNGDCHINTLTVKTVSGDIEGELESCGHLELSTVSGDVQWRGSADRASVKSTSGDVILDGAVGSLSASSMSGDIEVAGSAEELKCSSMSGDLRLETAILPQALSVSSKSGDCHLRLPDEAHGGFTARLRTVSGSVDSAFPITRGSNGIFCASGSGGAEYSISTVSGDITLDIY